MKLICFGRAVLLLMPLLMGLAMLAPAAAASFFLIGNSLTWDTVPSRLDGDVQWHVDCGKSLPYIHANPEAPCVKSSTLWPEALAEKQYDVISVQAHYGSTLDEDVAVISHWMEMQEKAVVVIHTGWARQVSLKEEYALKKAPTEMAHSPLYIRALIARLEEAFPGRTIRQTHAQDYLNKVAADIETGKAPFEKLEDVYRDAIHMNLVTGRYLMHNVMRKALGQTPSDQGFEKITPEAKAYFDEVLKTTFE